VYSPSRHDYLLIVLFIALQQPAKFFYTAIAVNNRRIFAIPESAVLPEFLKQKTRP
jgi:hypothetical protein